MSVVKRGNRYHVYIYDRAIKRKRFCGSFKTEKEAKQVFRDRTNDLQGESPRSSLTVMEYAAFWLEARHGEGTARPARATRAVNESALRPFLRDFGHRSIRARSTVHAVPGITGPCGAVELGSGTRRIPLCTLVWADGWVDDLRVRGQKGRR